MYQRISRLWIEVIEDEENVLTTTILGSTTLTNNQKWRNKTYRYFKKDQRKDMVTNVLIGFVLPTVVENAVNKLNFISLRNKIQDEFIL